MIEKLYGEGLRDYNTGNYKKAKRSFEKVREDLLENIRKAAKTEKGYNMALDFVLYLHALSWVSFLDAATHEKGDKNSFRPPIEYYLSYFLAIRADRLEMHLLSDGSSNIELLDEISDKIIEMSREGFDRTVRQFKEVR